MDFSLTTQALCALVGASAAAHVHQFTTLTNCVTPLLQLLECQALQLQLAVGIPYAGSLSKRQIRRRGLQLNSSSSSSSCRSDYNCCREYPAAAAAVSDWEQEAPID
jgi:hypothetical protein